MLFRKIAKIAKVLKTSTNLDERALGLGKLYELADRLGQKLVADAREELGPDHPACLKLLHLVTASETHDGESFTPTGHGARWALGASEVIRSEMFGMQDPEEGTPFDVNEDDDDDDDGPELAEVKDTLAAVKKANEDGAKEFAKVTAENVALKAAAAAAKPTTTTTTTTPKAGGKGGKGGKGGGK